MKNLKNAFRIVGLTLLILLALFGVGIMGNFNNNRERYMDKRITTEQTDKKNQEGEESSSEKDS